MPREVGIFREFGEWYQRYPSILDSVQAEASPNEEQIAAYLESGHVTDVTFRLVADVIDPDGRKDLKQHSMTDGQWEWRADLAYYVKKYHLRLPSEFIDHMRKNEWQCPAEAAIASDLPAAPTGARPGLLSWLAGRRLFRANKRGGPSS